MKARIVEAGMTAVIASWMLALAAWAGPIGHVMELEGSATAASPGETVRTLAPEASVFLNDTLTTGPGAKMQILFADESLLAMGERSILTLDEYTYAPQNKEKNHCAMHAVEGVFKIISGEITKLNPSRFQIRTPLATLGIRGCHFGLDVTDEQVKIFVLSLRSNEIILVQAHVDSRGEETGPESPWHEVPTSLQLVTVSRRHGLEERTLTMNEAVRFIESVTPGNSTIPDTPPPPPAQEQNSAGESQDIHGEEQTDLPAVVIQQSGDGAQGSLIAEMPEEQSSGTSSSPRTPDEPVAPESTPSPSVPQSPSGTYNGPSITIGPGTLQTFVVKGSGTAWQWGSWEDQASTPHRIEFQGSGMATHDMDALFQSPYTHTFSGMGSSAALVTHDGRARLLEGGCSINLSIGANASSLYGSVDLNNPDGDALHLGLAGSLDAQGQYSTVPSDYYLRVDGQTLDAFTQGGVTGFLVGNPPGNMPGAFIGQYEFQHGSETTVQGGFGTDLSP